MTRKDFELIAEILNGAQSYEQNFNDNKERAGAIKALAHTFAGALVSTNPRFDSARFLTACGVN